MRCACGYKLTRLGCPICDGRQIAGANPKALIPKHLRGFTITQHFESLRHYYGWRAGVALGTDRGRREIPEKVKDMIYRKLGRSCRWPSGCTTGEPPTIEHIVPVAFGGSNHPANLSVLCPTHQRASWARYEQLCIAMDGAA